MSESVEKKIVELDFDNEKFKRGISETLNGMKQLNNAFDLSKSTKSVDELDKAVSNVDVSKMTSGVEKVKAEFSILGAVGFSAINKITSAVLDMGSQMVNSITFKPITDGLDEYTLKMNSIKTIQTNTMGKNTLEEINGTLGELNEYADKTIYNFAQMTKYVGTFTASGVGLKESAQAIQGISNLAAAAGSNAQQAGSAMYNLSQSLATGRLQLIDWKSVQNAGMGGQLFQNALLRTSEALGTGGMDAIAKQGSFNESLQEGWATAEVLTKTLRNMTLATNEMTDAQIKEARAMLLSENYTEDMIEDIFQEANAAQVAATKVKTFQQLIDTTQEALGSGWAQTWEYIVGDIQEAENFFTMISNAVNGVIESMTKSRNEMFKEWHDNGGRDALILTLVEFANIVQDLTEPILEAFQAVFKPLSGKQLAEGTKGLLSIVQAMRSFFEESALGQGILNTLKIAFTAVFTVIKTAGDIVFGALKIGFGIVWTVFGTISNVIDSIVDTLASTGVIGAFENIISKIKEFYTELKNGIFDGISNGVKTLKMPVSMFVDFITSIGKNVEKFFSDNVLKRIKDFLDSFGGIGNVRTTVMDTIVNGFKELSKIAENVFQNLKPIGDFFSSGLEDISKRVSGFVESVNIGGVLSEAGNSIGSFFNGLFNKQENVNLGVNVSGLDKSQQETNKILGTVYKEANKSQSSFSDTLTKGLSAVAGWFSKIGDLVFPLLDRFRNWISSVWSKFVETFSNSGISLETFTKLFDSLGETFSKVFDDGIHSFDDFLKFMSKIKDNIGDFAVDIGSKFSKMMGDIGSSIRSGLDGPLADFWDFLTSLGSFDLGSFVTNIPTMIGDFFSSITGMFRNPLTPGSVGSNDPIGDVSTEVFGFTDGFQSMVTSLKSIATTITNPLTVVKNFFTNLVPETMKSIFDSINSVTATIDTDKIKAFVSEITSVGMSAAVLWGAFSIDNFLTSFANVATQAKAMLASVTKVFDTLNTSIANIGNAIKRDINANAFLKYIGGIVVLMIALTGCIKVISDIPDPGPAAGILAGVTSLFIVLGMILGAINRINPKSLASMGIMFAGIAAMIAIVGQTIHMIATMENPDSAYPVLIGMGAFILGLILLTSIFGNFGKFGLEGAALILGIAIALKMMCNVIKAFAAIPMDQFTTGIGRLAEAMLVLIAPLIIIGLLRSQILSASLALFTLSGAVVALGVALLIIQNVNVNIGTMLALAGGLVVLGAAMKLLELLNVPETMFKAAGSLALISVALVLLATAVRIASAAFGGDTAAITATLMALSLGLIGFGVAIAIAGGPNAIKGAAGILIVSLALSMLAGVLIALSIVKWDTIFKAGAILLGLVAALVVFSVVITSISPALAAMDMTLTGLGIALMLISGSVALFVAAVIGAALAAPSAVRSIIDAFNIFQSEMSGKEEEFVKFGYTLGRSLAAVVIGFLTEIGKAFDSWLQSWVPDVSGLLDNLTRLIGSIVTQLGAMALEGIKGLGGIITDAVAGVFGDATREGASSINPELLYDQHDWSQPAEKAASDYNEAMANKIEESKGDISDATETAVAEGAGEGAEEGAEAASEKFNMDEKSMATNGIDKDLLAQFIGQEAADAIANGDMSAMTDQLGINLSGSLSSGMLSGASENSIDPSQLMSNLKLTPENYAQSGTDVGKTIGGSISTGTSESLSTDANVSAAITGQAESIKTHAPEYQNAGGELGKAYSDGVKSGIETSNIDDAVRNSVSSFGSGISTAGEMGAQTGREYSAKQIESISAMGTLISATVKANLTSAAQDSDPIGTGTIIGTNLGQGTSTGIAGQSGNITSTVATGLKDASQNSDPGGKGYQAGKWFGEGTQSGVSNNMGGMTSTVATAMSNAASDSDPGGKGYSAGKWFGEGAVSGINGKADDVYWAGYRLGQRATEGFNDAEDINSPSKVMIQSGRYVGEGVVVGMNQYGNLVYQAAADLGHKASDGANNALTLMSSLIDEIDWDADPVITPVLDLDSFIADAATMSSFMPDGQVSTVGYINRLNNDTAMQLAAQSSQQNPINVYVTLDWKAGTSANQMVSELADELKLLNLTGGR